MILDFVMVKFSVDDIVCLDFFIILVISFGLDVMCFLNMEDFGSIGAMQRR